MTNEDLHKIIGEIEDVSGLSDLHLHLFKMNDMLEDVSFSELVDEEEDQLTEWLEGFHETTEAIVEDLGATSYDLTVSGGTAPISFSITFDS